MVLLALIVALCSAPSGCSTDIVTRDETLSQRGGWVYVTSDAGTLTITIPAKKGKPVRWDFQG